MAVGGGWLILGFGYGGRWLILNGGGFVVVVVGGGGFRSVGVGCGGGGGCHGWLCGFCICLFFCPFRLF